MSNENNYFVHQTSLVDPPCEIGEGTKIWHWVHVMPHARIGRRCVLGQNVFVGSRTVLGDNVKVQNNVSIYEGVELEDDVFCGPSMVFTNVINPRSQLERKEEFMQTLVRRGASIGANATVVCGNTIGRYAFIGAATVVTRDVPDYALLVGVPGKVLGWVSRAGRRLDFSHGPETRCPETGERYRLVNDQHVECLEPEPNRTNE